MRSGFLPARIVHVHPTRLCNLACAHCYSSSSPHFSTTLDLGLLLDVLGELRTEGYEVLSVSGGEPLVYRGLLGLLRGAATLGYRIHLVTNGLLLTRDRLATMRDCLDQVAVSFDGAGDTHNRVRGRPDAFEKANAALEVLALSDVPFALAFGVSTHSLPDIPWAYERAREVGASLLHLRPLVSTGRAQDLSNDWFLSAEDCARLFVLGGLLDYGTTIVPRVQVDLVGVHQLEDAIKQFPSLTPGAAIDVLSDHVNPIVIDDAGRMLPFTYGINRAFLIGELTTGFKDTLACYKHHGGPRLATLIERAFADAKHQGFEYLDWFAHVTRVSEQFDGSAEMPGAFVHRPWHRSSALVARPHADYVAAAARGSLENGIL